MASYNYTQDQLADFVDDSGVFSSSDRDEIIHALQNAGIFSSSSPSGTDAHVHVLGPDEVPTSGDEVAYYTESPGHPVTLDPAPSGKGRRHCL